MIPFGVGVGDFLAVGKLIGQIAIELRENGEAAPAYQSLLLELEALERALQQLNTLKPTQHELLQLNSIRATALSCERPLQRFLDKISKFDARLGITNVKTNRYKGFPRRIQWQLMYKKDAKEIRAILGSHVSTINLLLMTQTVQSVTRAEDNRAEVACGLEQRILAHRRLLEDVNVKAETSLNQHSETISNLENQEASLNTLVDKAEATSVQLRDQNLNLHEVRSIVGSTQEQTMSILASATEILSLVTSGLMTLRSISEQMYRMLKLCADFTHEMRTTMTALVQLFSSLQASLRRIERSLPLRINLPIVQFTDALGETMALPFQICQQFSTFKAMLGVIFLDKPGKWRVDLGQYLIMNGQGGRLLTETAWKHSVRENDHLLMCMVLNELYAHESICPFPSCQVSLEGAEASNGGRTCKTCGRWALLAPRQVSQRSVEALNTDGDESESDSELVSSSEEMKGKHNQEYREDFEIYRQVRVQEVDYFPFDMEPGDPYPVNTEFAVVSLAIQLSKTIREIQQSFDHFIQMFAMQLGRLTELLHQLETILENVRREASMANKQRNIKILGTMKTCEDTLADLKWPF